jgi:prevent-host-death family protein
MNDTKTVTAKDAQNNFGSLTRWVLENQGRLVVENRGKPAVVIISPQEDKENRRMREMQRRREALERLRQLRARVRAQNEDLTEEQADRLADELVRESIESLEKKGKIRYERRDR